MLQETSQLPNPMSAGTSSAVCWLLFRNPELACAVRMLLAKPVPLAHEFLENFVERTRDGEIYSKNTFSSDMAFLEVCTCSLLLKLRQGSHGQYIVQKLAWAQPATRQIASSAASFFRFTCPSAAVPVLLSQFPVCWWRELKVACCCLSMLGKWFDVRERSHHFRLAAGNGGHHRGPGGCVRSPQP